MSLFGPGVEATLEGTTELAWHVGLTTLDRSMGDPEDSVNLPSSFEGNISFDVIRKWKNKFRVPLISLLI